MSFFKQEPEKTWFEKLSEAQLNGRSQAGYLPVAESLIEESDKAYGAEYQSNAFTSLIPSFRGAVSQLIYLHSSAKAMFLLEQESGLSPIAPSQVFGAVSAEFLEMLDAAIDETHTDLLILSGANRDIDLGSRGAVLARAAEVEHDDYYHSLWRYRARLLRLHLSQGGRERFLAYRRATIALHSVGLFRESQVGPLALDMFPSLARRADELIARRGALAWRPERDGDCVIDL